LHLFTLVGYLAVNKVVYFRYDLMLSRWQPCRYHQPATSTYKVLSTQQPAYLYNLISYHQSGRLLRSSSQSLLHVPRIKPRLDVVLSPLLLHKSGIIYVLLSESHHHLTPSNVTSKLTILSHH